MASKPRKPTGAPKTWRKVRRMNPMQRFKMYNPLQMDYTSTAIMAKDNISFSLNRNKQHHLQKIHLEKIKKSKKALTKQITSTMNNSVGKIVPIGTEKTFQINQNIISNSVNINTSKKYFNIDNLTEYGPYIIDYTLNGKYLGLCGKKGHLSIIKWKDFRLISEEYFMKMKNGNDYIHDIKFAFNESMICCAQREGVYIYNTKCIETHVLRYSMPKPLALEYLPYHFLLCSIGLNGKLVYFDISLGKKISTKNTKLGESDVIKQNKRNGVIHLGHNNGCVTLWTPTNDKYVANILCHKNNRITSLDVDHTGYQMTTSDINGYLKIWDLRIYRETLKTYKSNSAISCLSYSQKGLLAFSTGRSVIVWNIRKNFRPSAVNNSMISGELNEKKRLNISSVYLQHTLNSAKSVVTSLKFCPYEDVLGIGNDNGFTSIIVPGSGEPNYDIFVDDPFQTKKQRNNSIVYKLLDKLQPDMIQLNPNFIGDTYRKRISIENKNVNRDRNNKLKWARKNVTKNVKNGYRGVLRKRNAKYVHMKDLYLRQQKFKKQLNYNKKVNSNKLKLESINKKNKIVKHLTNKNKNKNVTSALNRFKGPKKTNHQQFKSKWRRRQQKVYF